MEEAIVNSMPEPWLRPTVLLLIVVVVLLVIIVVGFVKMFFKNIHNDIDGLQKSTKYLYEVACTHQEKWENQERVNDDFREDIRDLRNYKVQYDNT
jgi:hypothetical protein